MHLFVERGIRGGIAMISHRFCEANNKYIDNYNPNVPSNFIMYLDANNLYGWAMSQALPTHGFQWVEGHIDFMSIPDDSEVGFILEVDIDYPQHLHDDHNDYPLAPEKLNVLPSMISPYNQSLAEKLNLKVQPTMKLVPNLMTKPRYIVHYRNLKQYVSLGLKVTKIHSILKFQQSEWLKKYILFNTEQRKSATSSFQKDLFKLLNNAVFGKTIENLRNRRKIDLVTDEKKAKKLAASPSFHSFKIINENLTSIERKVTSLFLNRPCYVGVSILEISKTLMYDFHYSYIKQKYGSKAILLFTDTDSLCYSIQTSDIYSDMQSDADLFDFSDYPLDYPLHSNTNKKSLRKNER